MTCEYDDLVSQYKNLPRLNISPSGVVNNTTLSNLDVENFIPTNANFTYYSTGDFLRNDDIQSCSSGNSLSFLHSNVRSVSANYDSLFHMLSELSFPFSIIGVTETKILTDVDKTTNTDIEGYEFESQPTQSDAGGVGFYIRQGFDYVIRDDMSITVQNLESLWIELKHKNKKNLLCGVVYRHPKSNIDDFMNYLNNCLDMIQRENKPCILMGDFNMDLLKFETVESIDNFINTLCSSYFLPYILQPTRITDHSATLIDNIFYNSLDNSTISGNFVFDISDHLSNFLIIKKCYPDLHNQYMFKRDYSKLDSNALTEDINAVNWQFLIPESTDIDNMFQTFYSNLEQIVDKHVPLKKVSKKELKLKNKPWITKAIRKSIQIKNSLLKKYLKNKSNDIYLKYKKYRNKLKHLINISKKRYYNDYFSTNMKDTKSIWKGIKQIVTPKSSTAHAPSVIKIDGKDISDKQQLSDAFNDYFVNIGSEISSSISSSNKNPLDYLSVPSPDSFFISPTTAMEIQDMINSLKNNKASGPFSIPSKLLKLIKVPISKPLEILYNYSFSIGKVPQDFKVAKVIPVFKKGCKTDIDNYRPISLISVFNKLLEKLMYNRILKFIEKHELLYPKQFGFQSNHSTEHALLCIVDKIQQSIENREFSCGIFLDFSKAFDTVDHKILIRKLEYYGFRGISKQWFMSYLENRKQYVSIGTCTSSNKPIACGVPQGSVLGPLLFLLYINDLPNCLNLLEAHLFADDTNLFYANKNLAELEMIVNIELEEIQMWLSANRLSLNIAKTNFVIFRPHQKKLPFQIKLKINYEHLKQEEYIKYLGIFIDCNLKWNKHINYITKKINRNIGLLSKLRYLVNWKILIDLYYSFIYPFLTYALIVWGHTYPTILKPLLFIQKRAIRIITYSGYRDHSSPLFKLTYILKLPDLIYFQTGIFMFKFYNNLQPKCFDNFFTKVNSTHSYSTRLSARKTYSLPKARTNYGLFSLKSQGPKIWNSINEAFKNEKHISTFKLKVKSFLIEQY